MGARRRCIPKAFRMGSLRFTVKELPMDRLKELAGEDYAIFLPDTQSIVIPAPSAAMTEDLREQIFYHELCHVLAWTTGSKDYGNEVIIDASAHALKQYMDTREFE